MIRPFLCQTIDFTLYVLQRQTLFLKTRPQRIKMVSQIGLLRCITH